MSKKSSVLRSPDDWDQQWKKWFSRYSKGNPRLGKWIRATYSIRGKKVLEIGGASGRESRWLAAVAESVTCVDFAPQAISLLASSELPANMAVLQADANNLPFPDGAFDLSFHKGVWILFEDDQQLAALLREQLRVTRTTALAIVQNTLNTKQVSEAKAKSQKDALFAFRFFTPHELRQLAEKVVADCHMNARIRLRKFGTPSLNRLCGVLGVFGDRIAPFLYRWLPWSQIECVVLEVVRK